MTMHAFVLIPALAAIGSWLACFLYRRAARRWGVFAVPNPRSSHQAPTPTGGGVGILFGIAIGLGAFAALSAAGWLGADGWIEIGAGGAVGEGAAAGAGAAINEGVAAGEGAGAGALPWPGELSALLLLAGLLMLVGFIDDWRGLPTLPRFCIYGMLCAAGVWALLGGLPWWWLLIAWLGALWGLNLFNFMDGIDGIAAIEALTACAAAAALAACIGAPPHFTALCLALAAACLGFLAFNWPPASLFMGDAGSIPLGFLLAGLALYGVDGADGGGIISGGMGAAGGGADGIGGGAVAGGSGGGGIPLICWLILLAAFIADASLTLIWRALTGQAFLQAHRLHMYQRLSRRWNSRRVSASLAALNLCWLAPLAAAALLAPPYQWAALAAAYLPLLALWRWALRFP